MNPDIRKLFFAAHKYTYLNSAAVAPMPLTAIEAVTSQLRDVYKNGSVNYPEWVKTKSRCRNIIASMLKVNADNIAFMRNTSDGFASVANGLPWAEGDNIVTFEREFPSNYYPWRRVRDTFGVEIRQCPEINGAFNTDDFIGLIDSNTKLVTVSAVQFGSGFRADLERIGRAARQAGALFAVDIIQAFGVIPFDLPNQYVDIAAGASHKWLCSPEGCGILYLSDKARELIDPTFIGWISVPDPFNFGDTERAWHPNALAFESGTNCSALFYGLEQSLNLLNETGIGNIQKYLDGLSGLLCEKLRGKDYEIISSRKAGEKSQIVCIMPKPGQNSMQIAQMLERENIIISPRGERLRIAPHFFNNESDIERLIEVLP